MTQKTQTIILNHNGCFHIFWVLSIALVNRGSSHGLVNQIQRYKKGTYELDADLADATHAEHFVIELNELFETRPQLLHDDEEALLALSTVYYAHYACTTKQRLAKLL